MELKTTPLFQEHLNLGATMGSYAGWDMPLYYGSQLAEHNSVRNDVGMFDVSHMTVIDITGSESTAYLRYLLANDVAKLKQVGQSLYSCMLTEKGGVVDDLIAYKFTAQDYRIVTNAATRDKDLTWLNKHAVNFEVEIIERLEMAMVAIQGPKAIARVQQVFSPKQQKATQNLANFNGVAVGEWWIARTGYTGEDGYEIILPATEIVEFWQNLLTADVTTCGLVARDSLRLEAGLNLYGSEMDETTSPLESHLGWTIAWEAAERDFIGRETIAAQKAQGVSNKLIGLVLQPRGMLRAKLPVFSGGEQVGMTTSGGFSPVLGRAIALARVPKTIPETCEVEIRGKRVPAKVVKPAFVKHGKILI